LVRSLRVHIPIAANGDGYLAELDAIDRGEDGSGPGRGEAVSAKIAKMRERLKRQCWSN